MARHKESERKQIRRDTRKLLLDAAAAEFAREGFNGANINRISKAAGFAQGTIYNYFESKRALMDTLIAEIAANHVEFITDQVRNEKSPAGRLESFFVAGFAFVERHAAAARVMITTLSGPDLGFRQAMYHAYQPLFALLNHEILAVGMADGIFRQVEPESTAALLMTFYLGSASQVDETGKPWLDARQVADFARQALRPET